MIFQSNGTLCKYYILAKLFHDHLMYCTNQKKTRIYSNRQSPTDTILLRNKYGTKRTRKRAARTRQKIITEQKRSAWENAPVQRGSCELLQEMNWYPSAEWKPRLAHGETSSVLLLRIVTNADSSPVFPLRRRKGEVAFFNHRSSTFAVHRDNWITVLLWVATEIK